MVDISNVVNITVQAAESSLGNYNINAFLYLASEAPVSTWTESYRIYKNAKDVATDFGSNSNVAKDATVFFAQNPNVMSGNGYLIVAPLQEDPDTQTSETLSVALARVAALVFFGGWMTDKTASDAEITAAATLTETMDCIFLVGAGAATALASGGLLYALAGLNYDHTKLLYYTGTADKVRAFIAAYASRAFSVNFAAQNSTITMNLKGLKGITADSSITETIYATLKTLGVDAYVYYGGVQKVVSNANGNDNYFDNVYNRIWFKLALKVAIFNALAATNTKIPQTEQGMDYLKRSARQICNQAVYNGFSGAGAWNGEFTFGNPQDFERNIADFGYYIYSLPVAEQSQSERLERVAPVIQIALKEAGAIHSANIIVTVEA